MSITLFHFFFPKTLTFCFVIKKSYKGQCKRTSEDTGILNKRRECFYRRGVNKTRSDRNSTGHIIIDKTRPEKHIPEIYHIVHGAKGTVKCVRLDAK